MAEAELASGDGWVSDDSSFYGDEDEQEQLQQLCNDYNIEAFWLAHEKDLNVILAKRSAMPPLELFNPRQGSFDSWQLGESVDDFIKRLPPLTTPRAACEWIWVENPYRQTRGKPDWPRVDKFKPRGFKLLEQSLQERQDIEMKGASRSGGTITQMLNQESRLLQERITRLAEETNVLSGKWMLFPELQDVTRVWRMVVEAVISNRLGSGAKVAPDEGRSGARLICIYTKDFRDKADVLRVLQELKAMGLVSSGKPIYYKSDPYTWLDIYRENAADYGLHASLYSSQKMLAEANFPGQRLIPQKQQSTLNGCYRSGDPMDVD